MSASLTPTVAQPPTAVQTAAGLLAAMTALTGISTDINTGGQLRTFAEVVGAVADEQGAASVAYGLQSLAYGAMSLFGIPQSQAMSATGVVTFATSLPLSAAFNVPQAVPIPSGTLVQTAGGIQFATTANTVLASGTPTISVGIIATAAGSAGNVPSGSITGTPLTPVGYPLYCANTAATAGGSDAATQSQALGLFAAKAASLGLASPQAVANACIGIIATGTGEIVQFSSVYEPWIAAGSGAGSGTAGFTVYVDNGTGTASPSLVAAVQSTLYGGLNTSGTTSNAIVPSGMSGFRPAGMPFTVSAATPVYCSAAVSGVLYPGLFATGGVAAAVVSGVTAYFNSVGIAPAAACQPHVAAAAADAAVGGFQLLFVNLYYSGSGTPVTEVTGAVGTRVVLAGLAVSVTEGT